MENEKNEKIDESSEMESNVEETIEYFDELRLKKDLLLGNNINK